MTIESAPTTVRRETQVEVEQKQQNVTITSEPPAAVSNTAEESYTPNIQEEEPPTPIMNSRTERILKKSPSNA